MPPIKMRRVLVTGGTGFIGRHAVEYLRGTGVDTIVASRNGGDSHTYIVDLMNQPAVEKMLKELRPSHLLHFAWNVNENYLENHDNMDWAIASLHLLQTFARYGGKRAVFAGTCFEYDLDYGYLSEYRTPLRPVSFYGKSKAFLYNMAEAFAQNAGISFGHGRIFFLYGEHEKNNRLIPVIIESLQAGKIPDIKTPDFLRDYMYTGEAGEAFAAFLASDVEGAVNIASGRPVRVKDLVSVIADLLHVEAMLPEKAMCGQPGPPILVADTTRLSNEVSWRSRLTLEEGLSRILR